MKFSQANILKVAAVSIAIPRYAGAFALSAGFVAQGELHTALGIAEIIAGVSMAILEGFALAFILNKWRVLPANSVAWWSLLLVVLMLGLSLPLVAVPYLSFMQSDLASIQQWFPDKMVQFAWNFMVAGVPMLIVIGVGLADVNEHERDERQFEAELRRSRRKAELQVELSNLEVSIEQTQLLNELEKRRLRAKYKLDTGRFEQEVKQGQAAAKLAQAGGFTCQHCGQHYESVRGLNGHLAHCKAKTNGANILAEPATTHKPD